MKFCTYILKSEINGYFYIGSTGNLQERLKKHNIGRVRSTKPYKPWVLVETIEFNTRSEAFRQEKYLKTHQQKEILKRKHNRQ